MQFTQFTQFTSLLAFFLLEGDQLESERLQQVLRSVYSVSLVYLPFFFGGSILEYTRSLSERQRKVVQHSLRV